MDIGIMTRRNRWLVVLLLGIPVLVGAAMVFDQKFLPLSWLLRKPLTIPLVYGPTLFCAGFAAIRFRRGRTWPAVAFTIGLIGTGVFHQYVVARSYGNPGYMVPTGHIIAPLVSVIMYAGAFLAVWIVVRTWRYWQPSAVLDASPDDRDRGGA